MSNRYRVTQRDVIIDGNGTIKTYYYITDTQAFDSRTKENYDAPVYVDNANVFKRIRVFHSKENVDRVVRKMNKEA